MPDGGRVGEPAYLAPLVGVIFLEFSLVRRQFIIFLQFLPSDTTFWYVFLGIPTYNALVLEWAIKWAKLTLFDILPTIRQSL